MNREEKNAQTRECFIALCDRRYISTLIERETGLRSWQIPFCVVDAKRTALQLKRLIRSFKNEKSG